VSLKQIDPSQRLALPFIDIKGPDRVRTRANVMAAIFIGLKPA